MLTHWKPLWPTQLTDPPPPLRRREGQPPRTSLTGERAAIPAPRRTLSAPAGYAVAVVAVAVALGGSLLLGPFLGRTIFILFWPAVLTVAVVAGLGPALLASALSVVVVDFVLIEPRFTFLVRDTSDLAPFGIFLLASTLVSTLAERQRKAERLVLDSSRLNAELATQLENQAIELESQLEESQALSEELAQSSAEAEAGAAFLGSILESFSDPFVVQDADWRFRYINSAAARYFTATGNANPASMVGRVVWDLYPQVVGTRVEQEMKRAARDRVAVEFEWFAAELGTWSELHCYPLPDGGLATQWKDITARKKSKEAAHYLDRAAELLAAPLDSEQRLNDLAQLVVPRLGDWCAIDVVDNAGVVQQVAVAHVDADKVKWARELNRRYPPKADAPTGTPNVLRTGLPELYAEISDELIVASAIDDDHLRIMRELGLHSAMVVPLTARGRTFGALTIISAESRRRYTSDDLALAGELASRAAIAIDNARQFDAAREAQREAEAANRAKSDFLAAMSHELRTPLNAIAGYTELLAIGVRGPVTDEQHADLDRIQKAQRHLLGLITNVLNFARIEAGHVEFQVETVAVTTLLAELEGFVAPQLRSRSLTFHSAPVDEPALAVSVDHEKTRQILLNLLSNSVKFTPPGGQIDVRSEVAGDSVLLHVRDTGIGIPAERLEAVFEPFVQVHRTLKDPTGGVGLGLAISRDLARGMGGELTVRSTDARGSTFTLRLPRARH